MIYTLPNSSYLPYRRLPFELSVSMSYSRAAPGFPLTPPMSPVGSGFEPSRLLKLHAIPRSPLEWIDSEQASALPRTSLLYNFDIFQADHDSPVESIEQDSESSSFSTSPLRVASSQKLNARSNSSSCDPFRRQLPLNSCNTGSSSKSGGSLRAPDRFLPTKSPLDAAFQRFHANKDAHKLTSAEKLLRLNSASPDAFRPRRRATSPNTSPESLPNRQLSNGIRAGGEKHICPSKA